MNESEETPAVIAQRIDALALHERVKQSLKQFDYDIYTHKYRSDDALVNACKAMVETDEDRRSKIKSTPSAIRERFTGKYWQRWERDLKILEHASMQSPSSKPDAAISSGRKMRQQGKINRNMKGLSFGKPYSSPPSAYDRPIHLSPESAVIVSMKVNKFILPKFSEQLQESNLYKAVDSNIKGIRIV